jgi:hypothetical protein
VRYSVVLLIYTRTLTLLGTGYIQPNPAPSTLTKSPHASSTPTHPLYHQDGHHGHRPLGARQPLRT